jgi:hypothetical protein
VKKKYKIMILFIIAIILWLLPMAIGSPLKIEGKGIDETKFVNVNNRNCNYCSKSDDQ